MATKKKIVGLGRPILIMGLPGSGKTTLAQALAEKLDFIHWNADAVRTHLNKDLGFSPEDRIEQARRMRFLCHTVLAQGHQPLADFVCPTPEAREAFGAAYTILVDRIEAGRYEDTNRLFIRPTKPDLVIPPGHSVDEEVKLVLAVLSDLGYLEVI